MTTLELMPNTEPSVSKLNKKTATRVYVVAGIIKNNNNEILIAKRAAHQHQGGLWEFPGGKKENDEAPRQALERELQEELGIMVRDAVPFRQLQHDYSDKAVFLDFWLVQSYAGEPAGVEGQAIVWVRADELIQFEFPAANVEIVEALSARSYS